MEQREAQNAIFKDNDQLMQHMKHTQELKNQELIVFYNKFTRTLHFYSYLTKETLQKLQLESCFITDFDTAEYSLTLSPDHNYLLGAYYYDMLKLTTLDLIGSVNNYRIPQTQIRPQDPYAVIETLKNRSRAFYVCDLTTNTRRNLIATFTDLDKYVYKLWQLRPQIDDSNFQLLKSAPHPDGYEDGFNLALNSLAFNSYGDKMAMYYAHNQLCINDVDSNLLLTQFTYPDSLSEISIDAVISNGTCDWIDQDDSPKIAMLFKGDDGLNFFDIAKGVNTSVKIAYDSIQAMAVNQQNSNFVLVSTLNGTLLKSDRRTKSYTVLHEHANRKYSAALESQEIKLHSTNPNLILYVRDFELILVDDRMPRKTLDCITESVSTANFY